MLPSASLIPQDDPTLLLIGEMCIRDRNECAAHKDRHARIGEGKIGLEALVRVINHPRLKQLPFFLETPNDLDGYAREIALLRSHYKG